MSSLKRKSGANLPGSEAKKPKQQGTLASFFTAPKAGGPAGSFDKEKWVAKLTDEQKKLLKLEIDTLDVSWLALLKDDITAPDFLELKRFLEREAQAGMEVFPPKEDIYSWSVPTLY